MSLAADQQLQISRRRKVIISDSTGISVDEQRERAQLEPSSSGLNLDSLGAADEDDDADLMMAEKAFGQLTGSSEQQIGGEGQKQQRQRAKKQTIRIEELEDVDTEDLSQSIKISRLIKNWYSRMKYFLFKRGKILKNENNASDKFKIRKKFLHFNADCKIYKFTRIYALYNLKISALFNF